MNVSTNELLDVKGFNKEQIEELEAKHFIAVPKELQKSAERHLQGEESTIVPFKSKSQLAKWAEKVRKNNKIKLDSDE
jgi:hypothetical protein